MNIAAITARHIIDSRGNPTVEADVTLDTGHMGRAAVPSGASTGSREALELRDGGDAYGGKGVQHALGNIRDLITPALIGKDASQQAELDRIMCDLDATENKARFGANAILAVSLAAAKAAAAGQNLPLFRYIQQLSGTPDISLPMPMINIINGGQHAAGSTDIQEFMIIPTRGTTFAARMQIAAEVFHALKEELKERGYQTTVGDEGGYAPHFTGGNQEALEAIRSAVGRTQYQLGLDIHLALDVAASELIQDGSYHLATENRTLTSDQMIEWYGQLIGVFPIVSIEDGLGEDDWNGWQRLTDSLGSRVQLVGDDLLVTNTKFLERAISEKTGNAILIKPNQIGTLTETIQAVKMAQAAGWKTILSHRSGETEDTTIAHLAVGLNTGQIKTGSMSRSERIAKYNELLRIEESLAGQL